MRKNLSTILVTGGAGFIGSEFVRQGVKRRYKIIVVDKLTYAGDLQRLKEVSGRFKFYKADICNKSKMESIFKREKPQIIVHFAAETHVDRSIVSASSFIETNVKGTHIILDLSRKHNTKRIIHVSTDEVYGEIKNGAFTEESHLNPSSPYAASKAAADCLVKSYIRTYNLPAIIVRPCNNYGPWQYPEKFIPIAIYKALTNSKIPVYGKGLNKREWLYVSGCAEALFNVLNRGRLGEVYNIGSGMERRNIYIANKVLEVLKKPKTLIQFVKDRPGHDYRYSLNCLKMSRLGWRPRVVFEDGLLLTVDWHKKNRSWLSAKEATRSV